MADQIFNPAMLIDLSRREADVWAGETQPLHLALGERRKVTFGWG